MVWVVWLACGGPSEVPLVPPVELPEPATPYGLDERPPNPTCRAPDRPSTGVDAVLTRVFDQLTFEGQTTTLVQNPADDGWWYLLEMEGRVRRFANDPAVTTSEVVLDLTPVIAYTDNEQGLLGIVFHPDFATNGQVFLTYTTVDPVAGLVARVSRFTSPDGGATLDPASEVPFLTLVKRFDNHHSGNIEFGPDGMLYVGWGDGGTVGDALNLSQDLFEPYGKMLRIDVDRPADGLPYGIPGDNPFAAGGGRPEIYAYGFRNPWRWAFDPVTGDLWLGDVGMQTWEEIDLVESGQNYGWRLKEAMACNNPPKDCDPGGLTDPVVWYGRGEGHVVIGGHVYRGSAISELQGTYLFNDYGGDDVFRIVYDPVSGEPSMEVAIRGSDDIVDWAYGNDGESYLSSIHGTIWRIDRDGSPPPAAFPPTLSATGCVDPADPSVPVPAMIPFAPHHPFWSDGLSKRRWLAIPDGTVVEASNDGDLDLPVGSVLMKELADGDRRVETRLLVRHPDGFAGYTYRWRDDQSDADLLAAGEPVALASQTWDIPSRAQCLQCHTAGAGRSLGLELAQLDFELTYPSTGKTWNQLETLAHIGVLEAGVDRPGPLPTIDGPEPLDDRARAYLHVNCAPCHRPQSTTPVDLDLRRETPLAETGLCEVPTQGVLGITDARIVAPGEPERSVVAARLGVRGTDQMPPLGSNVVDEEGLALIEAWITSLASCP